jgi:hypothetical protein
VKRSQYVKSCKEISSAVYRAAFKPQIRSWVILALGITWAAVVLGSYYLQLWNFLLTWDFSGRSLLNFHGDPTLPYFHQALLRGTLGFASALFLMVSSFMVGQIIFDIFRVRFGRVGERIVFSTSLGIGFYSFAGYGLALVGLYLPGVLIGLASLPVIIQIGREMLPGRSKVDSVFLVMNLKSYRNKLWFACSVFAVGFSFIAALAPEREYDALWYHLYYPRLYLEGGRFVDQIYDYVSLYPMTWELWFGYGLSMGGQIGAKLLHFAVLPLTGAVVYEMARRFGSGVSPWLAVAIFTTVPTVMWEASTAYIDLALAFHAALFVYALLIYGKTRRWLWFLLAAFNLGMAVASKHLALFLLLIGVFGLFGYIWKQDRSFQAAVVPAALLAVIGLLPAVPWYARSFLATGNPVFPELYAVFGGPPERWDALTRVGLQQFLDQFGRPRTAWNLLSLPWHMTVHGAAYHGSLGPLFLILFPFLFFRKLRGAQVWILGFLALYLILWASPVSSFQMRFLVPVVPILAVLTACGFRRISTAARAGFGRRGPVFISAGMAVLMILNLPPFTFLHERDREGWYGWLNHVLHGVEWGVVIGAESQDEYLRRQVRSYSVWKFVENNLEEDAYVLTWTGGDHFYTYTPRIWAYSTAARSAVWTDLDDREVILDELYALGVTHIIADNSYRSRLENRLENDSEGEPSWLEMLYEDHFYTLYRILRFDLPCLDLNQNIEWGMKG